MKQPGTSPDEQAQPESAQPPPRGAQLEAGERSATSVEQEGTRGGPAAYGEGRAAATGEPPASVTAPGQGPAAPPSSRGVAEPAASAGQRSEGATGSAQTGDFEQKWHQIQAGFVDEPRQAIERADAFFEELLERFQRERQELRQLWERGENVSTEDLRVALQRYRNYFQNKLR